MTRISPGGGIWYTHMVEDHGSFEHAGSSPALGIVKISKIKNQI